MPIYERQVQRNTLGLEGPCLPVKISIPQTLIDSLNQQEIPIPVPITGTILIDTGASMSAIDSTVIEQLQLNPIGIVTLETAGGPVDTNTYRARFNFTGFTGPTSRGHIFAESVIVGVDLSRFSVNSILGRDLLKSFIMIYNGPRGRFSLAI